jgi:hypothetical protein
VRANAALLLGIEEGKDQRVLRFPIAAPHRLFTPTMTTTNSDV